MKLLCTSSQIIVGRTDLSAADVVVGKGIQGWVRKNFTTAAGRNKLNTIAPSKTSMIIHFHSRSWHGKTTAWRTNNNKKWGQGNVLLGSRFDGTKKQIGLLGLYYRLHGSNKSCLSRSMSESLMTIRRRIVMKKVVFWKILWRSSVMKMPVLIGVKVGWIEDPHWRTMFLGPIHVWLIV